MVKKTHKYIKVVSHLTRDLVRDLPTAHSKPSRTSVLSFSSQITDSGCLGSPAVRSKFPWLPRSSPVVRLHCTMKAIFCVILAFAGPSIAAMHRANITVQNMLRGQVDVVVHHSYGLLCWLAEGDQLQWPHLRPDGLASPVQSVGYGTGELKVDWWRVSWTAENGHVFCTTGLGKMHNLEYSDSLSTNIIVIRPHDVTFLSDSGTSTSRYRCTCDYSKDAMGIFGHDVDWSTQIVSAGNRPMESICTCNHMSRCTSVFSKGLSLQVI